MNRLKTTMFCLLFCLLIQACAPIQNTGTISENLSTDTPPVKPSPTHEPVEIKPEKSPTPEVILDPNGPQAVIESFYKWYFEQPQGEVLAQRTYQDSPVLSDIWKSDVGYLLDSFEDQAGYDPFTCSQNDIPSLNFDTVFISGADAYVLGTVDIEEEVRHYFVVQMGRGEGDWKIDSIRCPFDPQTATIAFYTWYLGYIYNGADTQSSAVEPRNPISDGKLADCFLMSQEFYRQVEKELDEMASAGSAHDPILNAQAVPVEFWVQPGQEGNAIEVRLTFGPQSARRAIVHLVESAPYYWQVSDIEPVEVPVFDPLANQEANITDWQEYQDQEYGFSLRFPETWSIQYADLSAMPEDNPVRKGVFFTPVWADPNLPVLWLQVFKGSDQQLNDYYPIENRQQTQINDTKVWVDRDQCETRFAFRHPHHLDLWIVVGDTCPRMAGRERYQEELEGVIEPLLRTVKFE